MSLPTLVVHHLLLERAGDERELLAVLDQDDRERAAAFTSDPARRRFVAGRATLRAVLAEATGTAPRLLRFDRTCQHCGHPSHGRPRLAGGGPAFSLSHSGRHVLVATGPDPVGVDVEDLERRPMSGGVLRRSATPREATLLPADGHPDRPAAVLSLWTRKEAVAKALGLGLVLPFGSFEAEPGAPIGAGPPGSPVLEVWAVSLDGAVAAVAAPAGTDPPTCVERTGA